MIGELTALLFHYLFCRVVIEQCDRTVGCNRTPVIGQMKQPIKCLPFPTKMCKLKEIGEKDFFFLLLIIFSSATLVFFLFLFFFSTATSLFIHTQFFSPSATFAKPAPYPQSANFYCVLWWTARWPFKKRLLSGFFFFFKQSSWFLFSFPLNCHCVLPDYLPASHLVTALLGEPAILRHSRRSHVWKKVAVKKHDVTEVDSLSRPLSNELKFLCKLPLTIFLA